MENLNDRRVKFFQVLVNKIGEIRKEFPEFEDLIPRVLSNPIFDYTQKKEYSIGEIYHKDGMFLKKKRILDKIDQIETSIEFLKELNSEIQEKINNTKILKPKKLYLPQLTEMRNRIKDNRAKIKVLEGEIRILRRKTSGLTSKWLVEHVYGRDFAAKKILEILAEKNAPITKDEAEDLLKKLAITIRVEIYVDSKGTQWHTKLNKDLEEIQKGNTTWEGYKGYSENCGYVGFEDIPKEPFSLENN